MFTARTSAATPALEGAGARRAGPAPVAMGSKKAKTALDEIIAARNSKQAKKSVKQLYLEASGELNPKVCAPPRALVPGHQRMRTSAHTVRGQRACVACSTPAPLPPARQGACGVAL